MRAARRFSSDPFTDLLFNALLGFTLLFLIAIIFVNPLATLGNANLKAEYIISVTWPDYRPDDVDIWVEDPNGEVLSYLNKEAGWLHLDRDDRGDLNDTIIINGEEIVHPINQEIVTVRGIVAGEYTINLYYYKSGTGDAVPVTVKIEKVNPVLELVYVKKLVLEKVDTEKTVVRLRLSGDGSVAGLRYEQKMLTPYLLEPAG